MSNDPRTGSGAPKTSLWRDEEATDEVESLDQPRSDSLWREDEGSTGRPTIPKPGNPALWGERPPTKTETGGSGSNGSVPKPKGPRKRKTTKPARRARRVVWIVGALLVLALVADGVTAVLSLKSSLESSAGDLNAGRRLIEAGRLEEASEAFDEARDEAEGAEGMLSRPAIKLLSYVPVVDRDIEALTRVTEAAEGVAGAGHEGVRLATDLGVSEDGLAASIYDDGVVQIDQLELAQPRLAGIADSLRQVENRLFDAPRPVFSPLREALGRARSDAAVAAETARDGAALFDGLPEILGGEGERRYLLAFQAIGEARATGGVIGLYGILKAEDGELDLGRIGPYADVVPVALPQPVDGPGWFETSYGPQYATRQWQQANSSPNFPVVSEVLLEMFERGQGQRLDGVIGMDPIALEEMMQGTGPLEIPGEKDVTADEVSDVLLRESYQRFEDPQAQDRFLAALVNSFWTKVKVGDFDPTGFAAGLGEATRTRHLSVYSRTPGSQRAMSQIGAAGEYAEKGEKNVQMFFHNNYSVNKVDYFLRRSTSTDIRLTENGEALVTTEVRMKNLAPGGPDSLLLGPGVEGDEAGLNRMLFNVLVPRGATFEKMWVDGTEVPLAEYNDGKFPVAWDVLEIPPGEATTVTVAYRVVNAISVDAGIPRLRYRLVPQALPTPEEFSLTIEAASGLALAEGHPDTPGVEKFRTRGVLDVARTFDFVIVEASD